MQRELADRVDDSRAGALFDVHRLPSLPGGSITLHIPSLMRSSSLSFQAMSTVPTKKIAQITTGQKKEGKGGNADVKTTSGIDKKGKKQHMYDDPLLKNL